MATITPTLPAYLSHFTHPGLYSAVNITTGGGNKTNPAIIELYRTIMDSLFPNRTRYEGSRSTGKASDPKAEEELTKQKTAASTELKRRLIISLDMTNDHQEMHDRECHERMIQDLQPYLAKGLTTLTPADIEAMIKSAHVSLFFAGSSKIPFPGTYRTTPIIVNKSVDGENLFEHLMDAGFMVPHLRKKNPGDLPTYASFYAKSESWASKMGLGIKGVFPINQFYYKGNLTPQEQAFLIKYVELRTALPEDVPAAMARLTRQLCTLLKLKQDPIRIAAIAHMELVKIHPFQDGNGRVSRAMMNLILVDAGLSPIVFTSYKEYEKAVEEAHDGKKSFENLIRQKVEANKEKDPAVLEAEIHALALQTIWGNIPEETQKNVVAELFSLEKLLPPSKKSN